MLRGGDGGVADFSHLSLNDDNAIHVAKALGRISTTASSSLLFSVNFIGPSGASALAAAVASLTALCDLSMDHNCLGTAGARALAIALAAPGAAPALAGLYLQAKNNLWPLSSGKEQAKVALPLAVGVVSSFSYFACIRQEAAVSAIAR